MKALVLDFDGVICDSGREAFRVALDTYIELAPETRLSGLERAVLYERFVEDMPLGNRAEDFGVVLAAIDAGRPLPDQQAYDAFKAEQSSEWLRAFHKHFYPVRAAFARADPQGWRALLPCYPRFIDVLRRRAAEQ